MAGRFPRTVAEGDGKPITHLDAALAALAATQHGIVALAQLIELGLSASGARDRVARGALHRIHCGVYAVGHPALTGKGRWLAAVLAYERAALSHASAAALHGLRPSSATTVDVTVSGHGASRKVIRAHHSRTLLRRDITVEDRIPCTSVARTLLDLAARVDRRGLERACDRAETLRVFDLRQVEDVLARAGPRARRGSPRRG